MKLKKLFSCISMTAIQLLAVAQNDSTYVYFCATDDGTSGLMISVADAPNATEWVTKGLGNKLVSSDYGSWGPGKKMYNPTICHDTATDTWYLIFNPLADGSVSALTSSQNLIDWTVQEYNYPERIADMIPASAIKGKSAKIPYKDKNASGSIIKVPTWLINDIKNHNEYLNKRDAYANERTYEDPWRFASMDTISMSVTADSGKAKSISDKFIGIFFEDINYAADGGLYAELVQNRDFEYSPSDHHNDLRWNSTMAWSLSDSAMLKASVETSEPIHNNNAHYIRLNGKGSLINEGWDGIPIVKGETYNVSAFVRQPRNGSVTVELINEAGKSIGKCRLSGKTPGEWAKLTGTIKATETVNNARLAVTPPTGVQTDLDLVSIMPQKTFKGRTNGLRPDLAQALADLKPRFVRFPGGCVAHGNGIDNIYDWKGSIGPLEQRKGMPNLWGYHQSRGLGYYEFFQMCEDLGAEPLPVLAAGVPCQNSSTPYHGSHDHLTTDGQQCGIPMEEMGAYVQDILDLIEWANGDTSTQWGKLRAEAGHPTPFNLKMIGIGNEDLISEAFKERFLIINNAIKERYPEIEVVGTVGPFCEGADYRAGWEFARENNVDAVDEHYYVTPGWFIHNRDFYDNYDRKGPKVYLGEYASHVPGRLSNLEAALSIALYLTDVERNADVVTMTSYAPLFAKENHTQWRPDLIYFDNTGVKLTPDYYVQKMYGANAGTTYIPSTRQVSTVNNDVNTRLGQSIVIDQKTGDTIVRLVNMTPMVVNTTLPYSANEVAATVLNGDPTELDTTERTETIAIENGRYIQPPYSFTVLRFKNNR